MGFDVPGEAYDKYIGRYSRELAPMFADFALGPAPTPVLDVGCGPGALANELAGRFGASNVTAIDPSEPFAAACRARVPGVDVRVGAGEALPFADQAFGTALSQLVLSFVADADKMLSEMARVVRPGGNVAVCMFEANGFALVRTFWDASLRFDPGAPDDSKIPYRRMDELVSVCQRARLRNIVTAELEVATRYTDFDELWAPFSFGIGPAAGYLKKQTPERRAAIREAYFELLDKPSGAFTLPAKVLAVRGTV